MLLGQEFFLNHLIRANLTSICESAEDFTGLYSKINVHG